MQEIDVQTAKRWLDAGEAKLIDVRENDEYLAESVPGSELNPLSRFNPSAIDAQGKKVLLMCRGGRRSLEALSRLVAAGGDGYSIQGGIVAWQQAGLPVKRNEKAPLPIMRQVQITAGSLVFLGTVLGVYVHSGFFAIPAFVGAGLVFAGVTGTCGMASMLEKMPWNRILVSPSK